MIILRQKQYSNKSYKLDLVDGSKYNVTLNDRGEIVKITARKFVPAGESIPDHFKKLDEFAEDYVGLERGTMRKYY